MDSLLLKFLVINLQKLKNTPFSQRKSAWNKIVNNIQLLTIETSRQMILTTPSQHPYRTVSRFHPYMTHQTTPLLESSDTIHNHFICKRPGKQSGFVTDLDGKVHFVTLMSSCLTIVVQFCNTLVQLATSGSKQFISAKIITSSRIPSNTAVGLTDSHGGVAIKSCCCSRTTTLEQCFSRKYFY